MSNSNTKSHESKTTIDILNNKDNEQDLGEDWERKELPYLFEKELIDNSNKHVRLTTKFHPCRKALPLQAKFYARHEQHIPAKVEYYKQLHADTRTALNRSLPSIESRVIGWLPPDFDHSMLRELNYISAPKQRCCFTTYGEKLYAERHTERPAFNGLRFFLN